MMKLHRKIKNQRGQSTIEFLSTFTFVIAFFFVFAKIAINYTNTYLLQYANFMASRAYLVADNKIQNDSLARQNATAVFNSYNMVNCGTDCQIKFNSKSTNQWFLSGTYLDYKTKFSVMKVLTGDIDLDFRIESFLGKEPTIRECLAQVCRAFSEVATDLGNGNCSSTNSTIYDNGC
ncbi:hypothetical protein [Halobacteriovorax sp. RZ-1]|uniref:hypothetical protein n=2 Tax=unclassified Halobacteriovorax TaxID=2639665 RepID=UPI00371C93E9